MNFYMRHKRVFKKIICAIIPSHGMRHDLMSALEYPAGFRAYRRAARQMKKDDAARKSFPTFLAVCAIIKDEAPYMLEWLEYHKHLGVDKFYIYDNESTDSIHEILKPYIESGIVEYKYFPGSKQQLPAYDDCIKSHRNDTRWLAFIDLDEFILPVHNDTIPQMLARVSRRVGQIAMPWLFFGSNGHETRPDGLVIESYTKCASRVWQRKCIFNPRLCFGPFVHVGDTAGRTVYVSRDKLRVNHYYCKSWAEYQRRKNRGDVLHGADFAKTTFQRADFDKHDLNEVDDTIILKHAPMLREALEKLK